MMTGPEHYRQAERLLKAAAYDTKDSALGSRDDERDADFLRAAQAHATLALAAATACAGMRLGYKLRGMPKPESDEWAKTVGCGPLGGDGD